MPEGVAKELEDDIILPDSTSGEEKSELLST
jgi:hypothetical protein